MRGCHGVCVQGQGMLCIGFGPGMIEPRVVQFCLLQLASGHGTRDSTVASGSLSRALLTLQCNKRAFVRVCALVLSQALCVHSLLDS